MNRSPSIPKVAFAAVLLAFVFAVGCGPVTSRANHDKAPAMLHQLDESDNGRTVALRTGEKMRITLPENATTGYRWELERWDREVVGLVAEEPKYPSGQAVGSGGHVEFIFLGRKPGSGKIALKEWRPWEGEASVIARFHLHVDVQP
ncbi:MAG: protease inhibitor I42 family protein [Chlorobiaceae bacterium]|nr:protease inhibitor I42 family protein [Chlorobiaceae bacterium]